MRPLASALAVLLLAPALRARVDLLLVPPLGEIAGEPGQKFTLHLNNPTAFEDTIVLPRVIEAVCSAAGVRQAVQLEASGAARGRIAVPAATRVDVELRLKTALAGAGGFVSLRLESPLSNAIMFKLAPPAETPKPSSPPPARVAAAAREIDLATDIEGVSRHISAHDPIYFAAGWRGRFNARFQFSFKYRFLEGRPGHDQADHREPWPLHLARDLHLAYTQVSIWDLSGASKPFYDSSYKPTLFLLHRLARPPRGLGTVWLHYGVQHESNGKSGTAAGNASRSLNSLYAAPTFRWSLGGERFVEARPRVSAYFSTDENPDIARYRGHVELTLRAGLDRGWQLALHARGHPRGHGSLELDFTLPTAGTSWLDRLLPRAIDPRAALGGYLQVQYFNGYGESLLDYNVRRRDQLRFGFTLVR